MEEPGKTYFLWDVETDPACQVAINHAKARAEVSSEFEIYMTAKQWMDWYDKLCQAVGGIATLGAGFTFTVIVTQLAEPDPNHPNGSKVKHVRFCLALSWVLFVLSLACASFAALVFNANRRWFTDDLKMCVLDQVYRNEMWGRWVALDCEERISRLSWLADPENAGAIYPENVGGRARQRNGYRDCYGEPRYSWIRSQQGFISAVMVLVLELLPLSAFIASAEAVRAYENTLGWIIIGLIILITMMVFVFWLAQNRYVFHIVDHFAPVWRRNLLTSFPSVSQFIRDLIWLHHNQQRKQCESDGMNYKTVRTNLSVLLRLREEEPPSGTPRL